MALRRPLLVACVLGALAAVPVPTSSRTRAPSDYAAELTTLDTGIAGLKPDVLAPPVDVERTTRFLVLLYRRASLSGSGGDIRAAERAVDKAFARVGWTPDLALLRARLRLNAHRPAAAQADADRLVRAVHSPEADALRGDVALEQGRLDDARRAYQRALRQRRTWDTLARLAYLESVTGSAAAAASLYVEAEDQLTVKEMRAYAWLAVQRGMLELRHGRLDAALARYRAAEQAYSGYWMVDEHIAEALAAQGEYESAIARYQHAIADSPRPEIEQALGDLYAFLGRPHDAAPWHDRALAGYLASVERGETRYLHHLAGFYADVREDGAAAVRWARQDVAQRGSLAAEDGLAWALYRDGRFADARAAIDRVLAPGPQDAHVLFHGAMIHLAAGDADTGRQLLARAAEVNPGFQRFHAHR